MNVYKTLAEKLDKLPEGFPRTETGVELHILAKLFTPEEAEIACGLSECFQTTEETASALKMSPGNVQLHLDRMTRKRVIEQTPEKGKPLYRLEPFMVGFYEHQSETIDYELAHLMEHYIQEGGTEALMKYDPALHRVLPGSHSLQHSKMETILPYEDVIALIESGTSFAVCDCICRKQQELAGTRTCDFPLEVCMAVIGTEIPDTPGKISKKEARAVIDQCEEIGLVHTVRNVVNGVDYICNCCGCCCTMLRGITSFGIENSVAKSSYSAVVSSQDCSSCGTCLDRCQVGAVSIYVDTDTTAVIDEAKCIGCGLCVTTCPEDAITLFLKPEKERTQPPADKEEWNGLRRNNRNGDRGTDRNSGKSHV